tara:strand:- start:3324 stop:3974 length:651 start_codon:yes stop_codon:yes gene_type:complete
MNLKLKEKYFIDIHKGITGLFILLLMQIYGTWDNVTSWTYLGLHGTYGILWVLKSRIFPDKTWERKTSIWYGLYIWFGLTLYWASGWIINSGIFNEGVPVLVSPWLSGFCIFLFGLGVFLHFSADMYKHTLLEKIPGELITGGIMSSCRNINYFGELLIYLSFALLTKHWLPMIFLTMMMIIVWFPNMARKEKSLSRYPGFSEYRENSSLFIPYIY